MVGDYVARIYEEAKGRPLYVLSETVNLRRPEQEIPRAVVLPARPPSIERIPARAVPQTAEPESGKHARRI